MFLLDTNVVSELRKVRSGKADANVAQWPEQTRANALFLSVICLQELEIGVLLLAFRPGSWRTAMRLSPDDITQIRLLVQAHFGPSTGIWLFGSRLDDQARGGDIDLYLEPERLPSDNLFLARQALRRILERQLRQPVDLVVNPGQPTAFMRQARAEGQQL